MANIVTNLLRADGENVQRVWEFVKSEDSLFDFNRVIPEPEDADAEWRWRHWETRENAFNAELVEESVMRFDTLWSPAEAVVEALSARFPDVTFFLCYLDENLCFAGESVFKDGNMVDERDYLVEENQDEILQEVFGLEPSTE